MPFYIRKAFSKGPFRLNLSKSGLGFSFGVKGARIGINSRGQSYVHAGRHGLYYRKNLGSTGGKKSTSSLSQTFSGGNELPLTYLDTGVTFPVLKPIPQEEVSGLEPISPIRYPASLMKWAGWILLLAGVSVRWVYAVPGGILLLLAYLIFPLRNYQINRKSEIWIQKILKEILSDKAISLISPLPLLFFGPLRRQMIQRIYLESLQEEAISGNLTGRPDLWAATMGMTPDQMRILKRLLYQHMTDQALADHNFSPSEEAMLQKIESAWDIPKEIIEEENVLKHYLFDLRKLSQSTPEPVDSHERYGKNIHVYFKDQVKKVILKDLKVVKIDGVRHLQQGYHVEWEGNIFVTDKEIQLLSNTGVEHKYALDEIQRIELRLEEGVVSFLKRSQFVPVTITVPRLREFMIVLNQLIHRP